MKEPEQYIFEEWDLMCAKANASLHGACPLLEDETLVEMHKYVGALRTENDKLKKLVKPVVSCDELKVICDTVVELARIRQKGCNHLCVENFAQQCLGQLLAELQLNKEGKLRVFNTEIESN